MQTRMRKGEGTEQAEEEGGVVFTNTCRHVVYVLFCFVFVFVYLNLLYYYTVLMCKNFI
jgi:hypothetical protein